MGVLTKGLSVCVSALLVDEIKRIIKTSEIMKEDDKNWPQRNKDGRQELEIKLGGEHISFETAKIGSLVDVTESQDPEGLHDDRATWRSLGIGEPYTEAVVSTSEVLQQPTPPSDSNPNGQNGPQDTTTQSNVKPMDIDEGTSATQMMSPISVEGEKSVENELPAVSSVDMGSPAMGHDFSNVRNDRSMRFRSRLNM
ncbi:putative protein mago nashi like protein [Glarea lozoyensis 74030]|uniref:Uncharacterized protein n=1 Tax=Glarea lozoyensis (strain ATCC 74030 / MF5533) TaxID=1104152 RepID=H0EQF5_GLAL7|nr:putative protein mago nashi like protein [Glarea lozoyensis 74030]